MMNLLALLRGPLGGGLPSATASGLGGIPLDPSGMPIIPPFLLQVAHARGAAFGPTQAPDTPDVDQQTFPQPVGEANETPEGAGGPVPASDQALAQAEAPLGDSEQAILQALLGGLPLHDAEGTPVADFSGLPPDLTEALAGLLAKHPATSGTIKKLAIKRASAPPDIPPPLDIRNPS